MLCSMICTRSVLAFEGGHQISVNLFLNAGDSYSKRTVFRYDQALLSQKLSINVHKTQSTVILKAELQNHHKAGKTKTKPVDKFVLNY